MCATESHCGPALPGSSITGDISSEGIAGRQDTDASARRNQNGIHTDEERASAAAAAGAAAAAHGDDGMKTNRGRAILLLLLSPLVRGFSTSSAPVKTHTCDIYLKFLYIYIKLCLFSKKPPPEKGPS